MPVRLLIVDDHRVVRQGLAMFLRLVPEFVIVGEASNGAEALPLAHHLHPDVILMDLVMPVMDGVTAISYLRRQLPLIEIIALTSVLEEEQVAEAIRAGALGYLRKDTDLDALVSAVSGAAAGRAQVALATAWQERDLPAPLAPAALTAAELTVLRLVAAGQSHDEISAALATDAQTARQQIAALLDHLGVPSRTLAAHYALRYGLV